MGWGKGWKFSVRLVPRVGAMKINGFSNIYYLEILVSAKGCLCWGGHLK